MIDKGPNVIAVGYAKRALVSGSREYVRMQQYATVLGQYHLIVFTRKSEGYLAFQQDGTLCLYATNARTRIGMFINAYLIGRKILKKQRATHFVVSGQDPLVAGFVATLFSIHKNTSLHLQLHGDVFNKDFFGRSYFSFMKHAFAKYLVCRARRLRVVSERIKKSLIKEGIDGNKIMVLPIEADVQAFLAVGEVRVYRENIEPSFLYVGRFSEEKNIPLLLQAFAQARTSGLKARLTLIGDGPQKSLLTNLIRKLSLEDVAIILPWADDVPSTMASADMLCLSSLHEGFAMVLVEAMAAGLPVITTDVGCAGEIVKHGVHGYVVPVNDVGQYASSLLLLSGDSVLRQKFGQAAHLAIRQRQVSSSYLQEIKKSFTT